MVYTQHFCARCGSEHIRRNGTQGGQLKYPCKACGYPARFVPAAVAKTGQCAQVDALLNERNSQQSIGRTTGVARMTLAKLLKKSGPSFASAAASSVEKGSAKATRSAGT